MVAHSERAADGRELHFLPAIIAEFENVFDRPCLECDSIDALVLADQHFVEARRQRFDGLDNRADLLVLLVGDLRRDENAEMADAFMECIDDDAAVALAISATDL